jgi:hypothetical protein
MNHEKFVIEVDPEEENIHITDKEGNTIDVKGLIIFGGDASNGTVVVMGHGASADAAWAAGSFYSRPSLKSFYHQMVAHILRQMDNDTAGKFISMFNQHLNEDEIEEMWHDEEPVWQ